MSSALRLSVIFVLLLATGALALLAYNASFQKSAAQVAQVALVAPSAGAGGYFVAAHPLRVGTLARDEDFAVRVAPSGDAPEGAILDGPNVKAGLNGSLVRAFLDAGAPVTSQDVLRPRDRGFLASVLTPGARAVSIKVDAESGVSGLIWPGDHVDVVLTQVNDKADAAHRMLSEVVLQNVRIIAIDEDIVQGAQANNAAASKETHSVSLELAPEQVKKIAVAKDLGKLSLAIRAAVEQRDAEDAGTMFGCNVSREIARESAIASESSTVMVYSGDKAKEYSVRRQGGGDAGARSNCDRAAEVARQGAGL
jgi:pilus assembly protein CpaB